jgi:uncharacterized protein (DUF4415 family)
MTSTKRRNPKAVDDDNPLWTKADFKRARPATEVLPALIGEKAAQELFRGRGRPPGAHEKVSTTVRLDKDIIDAFRAEGRGWQTRINQTLREHMPRPGK